MDHKEINFQQLLRQYAEGTISQEDRYLLEKQALDDPFLFEALEGYQSNKVNTTESLAQLREKLSVRKETKKTRRIPLFNYGIAASLVLLLGFGLWFFNQSLSTDKSVAMNTVIANDDDSYEETESGSNEGSVAQVKEQSNNQYDSPKAIISQQDMAFESAPVNLESDEQGSPIPANKPSVSVVQSPPQAQAAEEIIVSVPTQSNEEITLTSSTTNESDAIVSSDLDREEVILNEVVVSGAASTKAKRSTLPAVRQVSTDSGLADEDYIPSMEIGTLVAPHEGMRTFKANLISMNNQLNGSADIEPYNIEIQFFIDANGDPKDIEITNGTDQDCINRLIAMVKYGGKWVTKPINSQVGVRLEMPCK